jgi:hypothetical protein
VGRNGKVIFPRPVEARQLSKREPTGPTLRNNSALSDTTLHRLSEHRQTDLDYHLTPSKEGRYAFFAAHATSSSNHHKGTVDYNGVKDRYDCIHLGGRWHPLMHRCTKTV